MIKAQLVADMMDRISAARLTPTRTMRYTVAKARPIVVIVIVPYKLEVDS